jgi:hypothetical protein
VELNDELYPLFSPWAYSAGVRLPHIPLCTTQCLAVPSWGASRHPFLWRDKAPICECGPFLTLCLA